MDFITWINWFKSGNAEPRPWPASTDIERWVGEAYAAGEKAGRKDEREMIASELKETGS